MGVARYGWVWFGRARLMGVACYGRVWFGRVRLMGWDRYGLVRYGKVWPGLVWFRIIPPRVAMVRGVFLSF